MSFKALGDAWRHASTADKLKFVHCMKNPLKIYLEGGATLEQALEALAHEKAKK